MYNFFAKCGMMVHINQALMRVDNASHTDRKEHLTMKTAIVSGASGSIGGAIATRLATEGYNLVLIGYRSIDKLQQISKLCKKNSPTGQNVYTLSGDLGDAKVARRIMDEAISLLTGNTYASIDLLVNCAGISHIGLLSDMTDAEWMNIVNTNLSSIFYCCRAVLPNMIHHKKGHIINISSIWGSEGASCEVAYSATKGGVDAFTKALAKELAPSHISVNAIACGMIDTPMNSCFTKEEIDSICTEIPAGRMGTPTEVADLAWTLAGSTDYLTGQIIALDGGWS